MSTTRRLRASAVEALLGRARQLLADGSLAACQLALGLDGEVAVFDTYGDADASTRFTLFSATKPITSAAVWQLIGEGLIDLDMPVAAIIPEYHANTGHWVLAESSRPSGAMTIAPSSRSA